MDDYFAVFGLPRKLQVDLDALRRRFYELSREHHPDFHQAAEAERQAAELQASALVNRAYRALSDPLARVEHLIALEAGGGGGDGVKPKAPRDLLEEMLEVQEALEGAKVAGLNEESAARLRQERQRLQARQAAEEAAMVARFAEWDRRTDPGDDRRPLLEQFRQGLATRAYLGTVIDDLSDALGEDQDTHVPHRRH